MPRKRITPPRHWERRVGPTWDQADKILARFGGVKAVADLLGVAITTVYRWRYPAPYGRDGLIPPAQLALLRAKARLVGILVTPDDIHPRKNDAPSTSTPTLEESK